eukprot:CAMPEP_0206019874 /NCGR_PEP_ID=MMETSP1464-20131121/29942_1 /ASSEMBLY_ACC=CAM_ASM_001124 /TAXON_ID=119497 /ORGANISM="Exanthemachrysis gayraliae, Strain RCC1523" /LENGTH=69 /DNA_ID=CAMNT_0053393783 /DNA_START=171 /DNA_END=380 /DNA_ORIENTATION=-
MGNRHVFMPTLGGSTRALAAQMTTAPLAEARPQRTPEATLHSGSFAHGVCRGQPRPLAPRARRGTYLVV